MQVRWRHYELIFATALFFVMGANQLFKLPHDNTGGYVALFKQPGVPYHYFRNILLPLLLSHLVPLALLILVNRWLLPRFLYHRHRFIILPSAAILGWILLTLAFTTAHYYRFYYLTAKIPVTELQLKAVRQALELSGIIVVIYLLYCCVRETLIRWISQEHANHPFRVMLCNRITATAFIYIGLLILFGVLHVHTSDSAAIFYVFIILPVIIIVFINVYGWFPYRQQMQLPLRPFVWKLLIAPFVLSLATWIFYTLVSNNIQVLLLPAQMMILLVIAIPVSWLLYLQQKGKLATLQLKKDLGKSTADLAFLRSQIHPHFLFNTLNTLYGTALQENATRTAEGVQRLGDMMRFLLHENNCDFIPLNREFEYLQNYIALQHLRIAQSAGVNIETTIHFCSRDFQVAPMLLIPFVENAFKHGIRLTSPSFIKIHFNCDDNGIYLDVVNSLHPKRTYESMPEHSGVGLQNVQQRLKLIYPGKHSLLIQQDDTTFKVRLHISMV